MRVVILVALLSLPASGQTEFAVASIKPSAQTVGPDYNTRITYSADSISARNVTLKRLVMEAYKLLPHQVLGPAWISEREYEIEAKADPPVTQDRIRQKLQTLLLGRFGLEFHRAKQQMRVYVLTQSNRGPRIHPLQGGEPLPPRSGDHFCGEVREYLDFLGTRLTMAERNNPDPTSPMVAVGPPIPVIDRTGLIGAYDFNVQLNQEAASDSIAFWQHAVEDLFGLHLESRREQVETIVIERARSVPTAN